MRVDWTTPARADLDCIWQFNLARGEARAIAVEDRLIAAAVGLLANPRIGRPGWWAAPVNWSCEHSST